MPVEISMPQLGESIAEGTLIKWHKKVGDWIVRDETLFEVSTDKVDTEIPSPAEGYLERILVQEGETVPVRTAVCWINDAAQAPGTSSIAAAASAGSIAAAAAAGAATAAPAAGPVPGAAAAVKTATPAGSRQPPQATERPAGDRTSPLVRRLAAEHSIDLASLKGSGEGGRVTKEDVLGAIEERKLSGATSAPADDEPLLEERIEPMTTMRQRISEHMLLSRRTSAHVTTIFEVDMTAVRDLKNWLSPRFEDRHGVRLTYLPFIINAVCRGLRKHPILNASIEGKNVHFHGEANIGIAVALEQGLIVPVIKKADTKDIQALCMDVNDLARRARSKELKPEDVQGGTFTITNPGVFGSIVGTPIIHQPQVGILCIGAVVKRPVVLPESDAIAVRSMSYFSLTFDHRLLDGSIADRFLSEVKSIIENAKFDGVCGLK